MSRKLPYIVATDIPWWSAGTKQKDMRIWLTQNIGAPYAAWSTASNDERIVIEFANEKDAVRFALTWL